MIYLNSIIFLIISLRKKILKHNFDSGLTIFQTHHCWDTPTPCGGVDNKTFCK